MNLSPIKEVNESLYKPLSGVTPKDKKDQSTPSSPVSVVRSDTPPSSHQLAKRQSSKENPFFASYEGDEAHDGYSLIDDHGRIVSEPPPSLSLAEKYSLMVDKEQERQQEKEPIRNNINGTLLTRDERMLRKQLENEVSPGDKGSYLSPSEDLKWREGNAREPIDGKQRAAVKEKYGRNYNFGNKPVPSLPKGVSHGLPPYSSSDV